MTEKDRIPVKPEEEFQPGTWAVVDAEGRSIGVYNHDGEYFAVRNRCLHDGGRLCNGRVGPALEGVFVNPGRRVEESFTGDVRAVCPRHGWEYYLETGEHVGDPSIVLPTYDTVVDDGIVYVEL